MSSLSSFVKSKVDPVEYYNKEFDNAIKWPGGTSNGRVVCCFHEDHTPSLHFDPKTGQFYCQGCGASGRSIVSFHSQAYEVTPNQAATEIYHRHIRPIIPENEIEKWHQSLIETPSVLRYVVRARRVSPKVIESHKLGWNGRRVVIPIRNEWGLCINAKLYKPKTKTEPKMLNYKKEGEARSYGSPTLFPYSSFQLAKKHGFIFIVEGEWDALALLSLNIPAITSTHGCKHWPQVHTDEFRGLKVIVCYDNDRDGEKYNIRPIQSVTSVALEVRRLDVPKKVGKDVTDWILSSRRMQKRSGWLNAIKDQSCLIVENDPDAIQPTETVIPLGEASQARYIGKQIRVDSIITGKAIAPFAVPSRYRVTCSQQCDNCPLALEGVEYRDVELDPTHPDILEFVNISTKALHSHLVKKAGLQGKPTCQSKCDILKSENIEQLILTPTLESSTGQFVTRQAYFVGHGLRTNRAYEFLGITTPHPEDQQVTHLFHEAKPVQDELDTFDLTPQDIRLVSVFKPSKKARSIQAHLNIIAEWQSRHITKIHQRPDLHIAVDLVFHSVQGFVFNGEPVDRGMLDVAVVGDTRCGKGYVFERLVRHYGLGEIASGENCSFAGLVGGCQQIKGQWIVTWGLLPLNHGRLVIVDEASDISPEEIGHMSRVRSEGIAEISKIVRESTQANTRIMWFANPRSGREISSYNYGVWAVKELMGNNEDISRLDLAMTVASNEVPSEVINAPADYDLKDRDRFPREASRKLILWAWSRKRDQVIFTKSATQQIIDAAIRLGAAYSPTIPLIQVENVRVKVARLSAAVAARCFSASPDGKQLIVRSDHVKAAVAFIHQCYTKPSMGYDAFSRTHKKSKLEVTKDKVDEVFDILESGSKKVLIEGMMKLPRLTVESIGDYVDNDLIIAKTIISKLVVMGCLERSERGIYFKSPSFSEWLRAALRSKHGGFNVKQ